MKYLYLWIVQFLKGRFMKTQRLKEKPFRIVTVSSQRKAEQITVLIKFNAIKCTDKNTNHDVFLM